MNPAKLIDAAFAVCTALERAGIRAVLTGGSAATFYAPHAYQSDDVDFIVLSAPDNVDAAAALREIGVQHISPGDYSLDGIAVEFPPGPLAIGSELVPEERCKTVTSAGRILHVLSPADAICDRLQRYYAWNDFSARAAAVAIVLANPAADLGFVRAWTKREFEQLRDKQLERFNFFLADLQRLNAANLPEPL